MRICTGVAALALVATAAACSTAPLEADTGDSVTQTSVGFSQQGPVGAVERAQDVADQVEQRQADIEAQLNDAFPQP